MRMATTHQEARDEPSADLVTRDMPPPSPSGFRHRLAQILSSVIHPLIFPLVVVTIVSYANNHSAGLTLKLVTLTTLLTALPVALVVLVQVKRGAWSDYDVSRRRQRYALYPFALLCLAALALLYKGLDAYYVLRCVAALVIANLIDGAINLRWKVSAHATTAAACAALLWYFTPVLGPPAAASALLVGWSRVELQRHTPLQVLAGWSVGTLSSLSALYLFR
jgi:membrane-associated phospholipid phosphatase